SSQISDPAAGPPAAPVTWPDPPPAVATVQAQEPAAVPIDTRADSVSNDAERTARGGEPSNKAGTPIMIIIFPTLALGLAVVGMLSRFVIKDGAARRALAITDHPEPDRVDDQRQHAWHGDQNQLGSVDEGHALIIALSNHGLLPREAV